MKKLVTAISLLALLVSGCGQEASKESQGVHLQATSEEYTAILEMTPGKVGPNEYQITITDASQQVMKEGHARLHFAMTGMDHGKSQEDLSFEADGKWHGRGPHIMMEGPWSIQLEWERASHEKRVFDFSATIEE